ncbi:J domain-containing protein [Helicobacter cholecystus]|uniref:J domain-containing protein n=1 Tax=Helicobacter cholecystus TaxID=45498 RepID=A0A3D8IYE7_9HELI|nr:J domain-containing protein [Helicobacter cholecystus]RDU70016.1 J domain-containing protein [Helicobacter cholecystus]VEJ24815.1 heat shock protein DnaJ domain-containing protein [Helicobacter cholecystus]
MIFIEIYPKYIEISVKEYCPFLEKILSDANKFFSSIHKLSKSILILDDSKKIKKQYFLNSIFHLPDSYSPYNLQKLFSLCHLPLRIKIVGKNQAVYKVCVQARVQNAREIQLIMQKQDYRTKRCLIQLFGGFVKSIKGFELVLDSTKEGFWDKFMNLIEQRIVGNLLLSFDFFRRNSLFATKEERAMEQNYLILDSRVGDDFALVRKKYLELVRKYHPDNVFLADFEVKQIYHQKFLQVQNAFNAIRASQF